MNTTEQSQIRQLTEKWRSLWSPQDKPFTGESPRGSVFFAISQCLCQ